MEVKPELIDQLAQTLYWNMWTLKEIHKEVLKWKEVSGARAFARLYLEWGDPDEALRMSVNALDLLLEEHKTYWLTHPDKTIRNMVTKKDHLAED